MAARLSREASSAGLGYVTAGGAVERAVSVADPSILAAYTADPVPNYIDQAVGEGIAIVSAAGGDGPVDPSAVAVLTDREDAGIADRPVIRVSAAFLEKVRVAGRASVLVNFTPEGMARRVRPPRTTRAGRR